MYVKNICKNTWMSLKRCSTVEPNQFKKTKGVAMTFPLMEIDSNHLCDSLFCFCPNKKYLFCAINHNCKRASFFLQITFSYIMNRLSLSTSFVVNWLVFYWCNCKRFRIRLEWRQIWYWSNKFPWLNCMNSALSQFPFVGLNCEKHKSQL